MSISFGASVSNVALLRNFDEKFQVANQAEIIQAARAGEDYLRDATNDMTHTPIDTGQLIGTVQTPIVNQYSVTFRIAGVLPQNKGESSKPRPYGFAQEFGWHDRAGAFHEGHHMVHNAALAARAEYIMYMRMSAKLITSVPDAKRVFGQGNSQYNDEGGGYNPGFGIPGGE